MTIYSDAIPFAFRRVLHLATMGSEMYLRYNLQNGQFHRLKWKSIDFDA